MSKKNKNAVNPDDVIIIRLWPKTPILYPMAFLALICGIVGHIFGTPYELVEEHLPAVPGHEAPANADETAPETTTDPPAETEAIPEEAAEDVADPAAVVPASEESAEPAPMGVSDKVNRSWSGTVNTILALLFLAMFAFSLFVVCIDFEVRWSLLGFVLIMAIVGGLLVADKMEVIQLPSAVSVLDRFTLFATPLFYYTVFVIWLALMLVSAVIARLHFVKIEHNEVVEYGGVMESQKRMSTLRMHWTKEIKDVFEYWLPFVRSGTLVFTFPNEEKPLILNNVLHINKVLKKLDAKSSSFQFTGGGE